jgi:hypothetical protein
MLEIALNVNESTQHLLRGPAVLRIKPAPTPTRAGEFVAELVIGGQAQTVSHIKTEALKALLEQ